MRRERLSRARQLQVKYSLLPSWTQGPPSPAHFHTLGWGRQDQPAGGKVSCNGVQAYISSKLDHASKFRYKTLWNVSRTNLRSLQIRKISHRTQLFLGPSSFQTPSAHMWILALRGVVTRNPICRLWIVKDVGDLQSTSYWSSCGQHIKLFFTEVEWMTFLKWVLKKKSVTPAKCQHNYVAL
jgi:hypothetical protein